MTSLNRAAMLASGAMLALLLLCGSSGIWAVWSGTSALERQVAAASLLRNHMKADMMHDAVRSDVLATLASADPMSGIKREEAVADLQEHLKTFDEAIASGKTYRGSAEVSKMIEGLAQPLAAYGAAAARIVALESRDHRTALAALPDFFTQFRALETSMESAAEAIEAHAEEVGASSRMIGTLSMVLLGLALAIGMGMAAYIARIARRDLVVPLLDLTGAMRRLSAGEADVVVPSGGRVAELGELTAAIGSFRDQLDQAQAAREAQARLIVESIGAGLGALSQGDLTTEVKADLSGPFAGLKCDFNQALASLRTLIGRVGASAAAIRDGSDNIARTSADLARRTESNAASLEETSAAIAQMDGRLKSSADSAARTVQRADQAIGVVASGRTIADEAVQAMGRVSESAKGIDDVIEGLDKIAFQTRVLAMNAAVEAGRAGEAGRGFAVVADLVSALAMRAEEEAKRARDQLTVTQGEIGHAVGAVQKVDGAFVHISDDVTAVHRLLAEMASDNQAQSAAVSQISVAVNEMDKTIQHNAALVTESARAAQALTSEVDELADHASRFRTDGAGRPAEGRLNLSNGGIRPLPPAAVKALVRKPGGDAGDWQAF